MNGNCGDGTPWAGNTLGKDYQAGVVPPPWTSYFPKISKVEALTPMLMPVPKVSDKYTMILPGHGAGPPGTYKLLHTYP